MSWRPSRGATSPPASSPPAATAISRRTPSTTPPRRTRPTWRPASSGSASASATRLWSTSRATGQRRFHVRLRSLRGGHRRGHRRNAHVDHRRRHRGRPRRRQALRGIACGQSPHGPARRHHRLRRHPSRRATPQDRTHPLAAHRGPRATTEPAVGLEGPPVPPNRARRWHGARARRAQRLVGARTRRRCPGRYGVTHPHPRTASEAQGSGDGVRAPPDTRRQKPRLPKQAGFV